MAEIGKVEDYNIRGSITTNFDHNIISSGRQILFYSVSDILTQLTQYGEKSVSADIVRYLVENINDRFELYAGLQDYIRLRR